MENNIKKKLENSKYMQKLKNQKVYLKSKRGIAIIVLSVLLLFSVIATATSNASGAKQVNNLNNEEIASLKTELEKKDKIISENEDKLKLLKQEKEKAENETKKIEKEKETWESEKSKLEADKKSLEDEKQTLNNQIEELKQTAQNSNKNFSNSAQTAKFSSNAKNTGVQDTNSAIVYITKTGKKYHRGSCSYLRNSKIEINLNKAKNSGYTACSRCF